MESQRSTVVGVFADPAQAERAVQDLLGAGFRKEDIAYLRRGEEQADNSAPREDGSGTGAMVGGYTGAAAGAVLGGALGAAVSILVPGFGPLLGAGMVGMMLAGAYAGGIAGVLIGMGVPEEEAKVYHREVEGGRTLVAVKAEGRYSEALALLASAGALDVNRQAGEPASVS